MSNSKLHNCGDCRSEENIECASCKLAFLNETRKHHPKKKDSFGVEEEDTSISERLTEKGNDFSILYLFVAAMATMALVICFSWLMKQ